MDDAAEQAREDAAMAAYREQDPVVQLSAAMRALIDNLMRPVERLVSWLDRRLSR